MCTIKKTIKNVVYRFFDDNYCKSVCYDREPHSLFCHQSVGAMIQDSVLTGSNALKIIKLRI